MGSHQNSDSDKLSANKLVKIKAEVKQAAINHLNTTDAATAISHYAEDVIAVSN